MGRKLKFKAGDKVRFNKEFLLHTVYNKPFYVIAMERHPKHAIITPTGTLYVHPQAGSSTTKKRVVYRCNRKLRKRNRSKVQAKDFYALADEMDLMDNGLTKAIRRVKNRRQSKNKNRQ